MAADNVDIHSRYIKALRTQAKTADVPPSDALPCPYCAHQGRIFQNIDQLLDHTKIDHAPILQAMNPSQSRAQLQDAALKLQAKGEWTSEATAGGTSTPDLASLSLDTETAKGRLSPSGKKRPIDSDFQTRRGKAPLHTEIYDPDDSRDIPNPIVRERTRPKPMYTPPPSSEWSFEANGSQFLPSRPTNPPSPDRSSCSPMPHRPFAQGQPELQRYDPRYPGLLLQPDSRPISQEQLASEVKSIYAGLTMVETKCIQVDRAQAAAAQDSTQGSSDHWQALIALHRTLLHEHHDFFLASQHPSASPALRRLAAKYSMPARMWKHGIHSFLELLRRRLPESLDYMLAFIYLAYQMMALLYETVPDFEDTWIECLGDLGRYRMAIEDEDLRDRETWAGVARSWYSKGSDKSPSVGRLYHHLAILARPNALQQLYYYARSLTCVKPSQSARESILTLLDPILGGSTALHAQPLETGFIQAHGILFGGKLDRFPIDEVPWSELVVSLNSLPENERHHPTQDAFPSNQADDRPLPDDYLIRGQVWSQWCFPKTWFAHSHDENADDFELAVTTTSRISQTLQRSIYTQPNALQRLYNFAISLVRRVSLHFTTQKHRPSPGFMSFPLALHLLIPSAAAESLDTTGSAIDSNSRQHVPDDTPSELLVASTILVAPMVILLIYVGLTVTLLWAKAKATLAIFMLITAIIYTETNTPAGSTSKESGHYVQLAVGLGYIFLMLAYCRMITMQSNQKRAPNSERKSRKHSIIFSTMATMLSLVATTIITAFPGSNEYWKSLTGLNPILALSLTTPLSFFLCDLVLRLAIADNRHGDENEEVNGFVDLARVEAGNPNGVELQDLAVRRWHHLVRGQRRRRGS